MRSLVLLTLALISATVRAEEAAGREQLGKLLREGVEDIHGIWEKQMGKPPLKYERLAKDRLHSIYGRWAGAGQWQEIARLELRPHGVWLSDSFLPKVNDGNWFLIDGMILLFDGPIDQDTTRLGSALVMMKDGKLRLLNLEAKKGYVVLKKQGRGRTKVQK